MQKGTWLMNQRSAVQKEQSFLGHLPSKKQSAAPQKPKEKEKPQEKEKVQEKEKPQEKEKEKKGSAMKETQTPAPAKKKAAPRPPPNISIVVTQIRTHTDFVCV